MAAEKIGQAQLPPHLREPGVDVEKHPPRRRRQHVGVVAEAHHVQQERGALDPLKDIAPRNAEVRCPPAAGQGEVRAEPELVHDPVEIAIADRPLRRARRAGLVTAHVRVQPVEQQHVISEPPEPQQVLEEDPGVPAMAEALGDGAGDDDEVAHSVLPLT